MKEYGVTPRYPDEMDDLTLQDAQQAYKNALKIKDFVILHFFDLNSYKNKHSIMTSSFKLQSVKPLFAIIIMVLSVYGCAQKITSSSAPANEVKPPEGISAGSAKKMESPQVAEGKIIYTTKCARCHGVKPVQDWTVQEWIPIMERMAPKARLDETEIANVTAYVNFYAKSGS